MNEDELAAYLEEGPPGGADDTDQGPVERAPATRGPAGATGTTGTSGAEGVRRLLADDATWAEPSSGGADALLAAIRAEAPQPGHPPSGAWGAPGSSGRASRTPPRWSRPAQGAGHVPAAGAGWDTRRRLGVAAAAVVLLVMGLLGGLLIAGDDSGEFPGGQQVALAGTDLQPHASGVADLSETGSGVEVWLRVDGLPPAEPGTYYQAWVKGESGTVTIGTFHMREGDDPVILWSGVDLDDYPTITVTLQQEGGGAESSGKVVLKGDVKGA